MMLFEILHEAWPLRQTADESIMLEQIKKNLLHLLNSRKSNLHIPQHLKLLQQSLLHYGIPHYPSFCMANMHLKKQFCRDLETAIKIFEPRFARVTVTLDHQTDSSERLHFQINAVLRVLKQEFTISWESFLQTRTHHFYFYE